MGRRKEQPLPSRELCPIFVSASETEIVCKACVNGARCTCLRWDDRLQREQQTNIFCKGNYKRCEQYISWLHFSWQDCD